MMRVESNGEGKLRAACDRCHDLKNRCTRTGGSESRCDRCERLDIDCVYNTSARMGRPRVSRVAPKTSSTGPGDNHARHTAKRRAVQSGQSITNTNSTPVEHHIDPAFADPPGNDEPVLGLLEPSLLPEGTYARDESAHKDWQMTQTKPWSAPSEDIDWDLNLNSSDFTNHPYDDSTAGRAYAYHQRQHYKAPVSDYPDSTMGISEKAAPMTNGIDGLLQLQCHLSKLLSEASESITPHQPALDEVMLACKDLLELLPSRQTDRSGSSFPGLSQGNSRYAALDPLKINYITVLQVATSYAYALQLLDLAVDNLKAGAENLALVSLGIFNLASQPAMSITVVAYMISSMVQQLRDVISLLTPEHRGKASAPGSSMGGLSTTTTPCSIQGAVNMVHEMETSLLGKLSQVMTSPYAGSIALEVGGNHGDYGEL